MPSRNLHLQHQFSSARFVGSLAIAIALSHSLGTALVAFCTDGLRHFGFDRCLDQDADIFA